MAKQPTIGTARARALYQVATIAGGLVLDTPYVPGKTTGTAYVPYGVLNRLNEALVKAGFNMEGARKNYDRVGEMRKRQTLRGSTGPAK